jgi:hypothetical protein
MTNDELLSIVPLQQGAQDLRSYIRVEDIPRPWRGVFIESRRGRGAPAVPGELPGSCAEVNEWTDFVEKDAWRARFENKGAREEDIKPLENLLGLAQATLSIATPEHSPTTQLSFLGRAAGSLAAGLLRAYGVEIDTREDPEADLVWKLALHVDPDGILPWDSIKRLKRLLQIASEYQVVETAVVVDYFRWLWAFSIAAIPPLEGAAPGVTDGLVSALEQFLRRCIPFELWGTAIERWPEFPR